MGLHIFSYTKLISQRRTKPWEIGFEAFRKLNSQDWYLNFLILGLVLFFLKPWFLLCHCLCPKRSSGIFLNINYFSLHFDLISNWFLFMKYITLEIQQDLCQKGLQQVLKINLTFIMKKKVLVTTHCNIMSNSLTFSSLRFLVWEMRVMTLYYLLLILLLGQLNTHRCIQ